MVADLHIHTCLSPCGELTMSPRRIVEEAARRNITWIAVADHNTASMVDAVAQAAADAGLEFLYGMELQTREEVHLLAYFDTSEACHRFADAVYPLLPDRDNEPAYFGDQVCVDVEETIVGVERKLLVNSLDLGLEDAVDRVRAHGGVPVPAHVDRDTFGLIAQLGFVPEGMVFDVAETVSGQLPDGFGKTAVLCSSDAHTPEAIGRRTTRFQVEACTTEEILLASRGVGGRSMACCLNEGRTM